MVLDPGSGDREEIDRLLRQVEARRADGASPSAVVLTHHHGDHVAGARTVAEALGEGIAPAEAPTPDGLMITRVHRGWRLRGLCWCSSRVAKSAEAI